MLFFSKELNFIGCNGGLLIGESILLHVALRCKKVRSVDASWSNVGDNGVEALVDNVERFSRFITLSSLI